MHVQTLRGNGLQLLVGCEFAVVELSYYGHYDLNGYGWIMDYSQAGYEYVCNRFVFVDPWKIIKKVLFTTPLTNGECRK